MRLIDAEELFNKVGKIVPRNTTHYKAIGEFMNMITNSSTIEPKQGEWITEKVWFTLQGKIFCIDYQCIPSIIRIRIIIFCAKNSEMLFGKHFTAKMCKNMRNLLTCCPVCRSIQDIVE